MSSLRTELWVRIAIGTAAVCVALAGVVTVIVHDDGGDPRFPAPPSKVEVLGRISIVRLHLDVALVEGVGFEVLRYGVGHYSDTARPGSPGNVVLVGERTRFGAPLRDIDRLRVGDEIIVTTPHGRSGYTVLAQADGTSHRVISRFDVGVLVQPPSGSRLTLISEYPKGSTKQRIIVEAVLAPSV
jgi:sortase A